MGKNFRFYLWLIICLLWTLPSGAKTVYSAVNRENVTMQTWNDLFFVKEKNRGADDVWIAYHVTYGDSGEMILEEYGRFAVDYYRNMKSLPLKKQEAKVIHDDDGKLRFEGEFSSILEESVFECLNDQHCQILSAYYDYTENPGDYPADSVAAFPSHKESLVSVYEQKIKDQSNAVRKQHIKTEAETESSGSWLALLMLIPLGLCVFCGTISSGGGISEKFSFKAKLIAVTETLCLISIPLAILVMIMAPWYIGILTGLALAAIFVYGIFFAWFVKDYITEDLKVKFPWLQAILFGALGIYGLYSIAGLVVMPFMQTSIETETWKIYMGLLAKLAIVILLGIWYRKTLYTRTESLNGSFWAIAAITIFGSLSVFALLLFVIAFIIFKGVGKDFIRSGLEDTSTAAEKSKQFELRSNCCGNCSKWMSGACPHLSEEPDGSNSPCGNYSRR